ncbi:uncharacterized protein LOC116984708 [Amblyraja radiata]|uniref:uncharacterized protein LOC116984708 n=1 Tax=Amblyraja radiata TaxID=386614 RepID=UPI0014033A42|nr:uncharacterized protein LOC116984708 [Amblyraja radiata]
MADPNYDNMTVDDFLRWKVEALKQFLADRGLKKTGRKAELAALAYGAVYMKKPVLPTAGEEKHHHADQYKELLKCGEKILPDPMSELKDGWLGESQGLNCWPPTSIVELSNHLASYDEANQPAPSQKSRLLSDYKEGKAYSYFDARWLKEVFFHPISDDSAMCFLKADCAPSVRVRQTPHKPWVCIEKSSGIIHSAYCSCLARLHSTCNHVAAILFKLDYAYQRGWTSKACTMRPCTWGEATANEMLEGKRICDMDWRKPSYRDGGYPESISPPLGQLFQPIRETAPPHIAGIINALGSTVTNSSVFQYLISKPSPEYPVQEDFNVMGTIEVETSKHNPLSLPKLAGECRAVESIPKTPDTDPFISCVSESDSDSDSDSGSGSDPDPDP